MIFPSCIHFWCQLDWKKRIRQLGFHFTSKTTTLPFWLLSGYETSIFCEQVGMFRQGRYGWIDKHLMDGRSGHKTTSEIDPRGEIKLKTIAQYLPKDVATSVAPYTPCRWVLDLSYPTKHFSWLVGSTRQSNENRNFQTWKSTKFGHGLPHDASHP